ncbi:MAG: hypothetical protein B0D91_12135 [Oceanospirillales bacterium LUC14_002_19_P2]|nr:MAG: hypothetical protein B0D91_12135 [Oceanospirillales bacterium LUC14_002_19_P2]
MGAVTGKPCMVLAGMILMVLAGCSAPPMVRDGAPSQDVDVSKIPDAVPQPHYGPLKNSPYQLAGVSYQPLASATGFRQEGIASWYGTKFHGRKTANGETYNMFAMTAAHKTLPLPSYVRVTNRANGRSVVLRVNDRGPFHGNRVIDLSYAAAKKLGFQNKGTANVVIEAIDTTQPVQQIAQAPAAGDVEKATALTPLSIYLQVAALSTRTGAEALQKRLQQVITQPVQVTQVEDEADALYRVRVGPLPNRTDALKVGDLLAEASLERGHLVFE